MTQRRQEKPLRDGITKNPAFWPIIHHPKLLEHLELILGPDFAYTQHSDLHINLHAGRFHRDSANRRFGTGPDWNEDEEPYGVVRVAIYLSDYKESGTSLMVVPGTHRHESTLLRKEYSFLEFGSYESSSIQHC